MIAKCPHTLEPIPSEFNGKCLLEKWTTFYHMKGG